MAHETDDVNRLQRSRSSLWIAATLIPLGMILVGLTALVLAAEGAPLAVDVWWSGILPHPSDPGTVSLALNWLGSTEVMIVIIALIAAVLMWRRRYADAFQLVATLALATISCEVLKFVVGRARPPFATVETTGLSFPSGHVTAAVATSVALGFIVQRTWMWVVASFWSLAMMWDRLTLGVHWLSDTIAAVCLAVICAIVVNGIVAKYRRRPGSIPRSIEAE